MNTAQSSALDSGMPAHTRGARRKAGSAKLSKLLNKAVDALNAAWVEAQLAEPGATLYLESAGTLYAMKPEPPEHMRRDTTTSQRQSLIIAQSDNAARCDVGAW